MNCSNCNNKMIIVPRECTDKMPRECTDKIPGCCVAHGKFICKFCESKKRHNRILIKFEDEKIKEGFWSILQDLEIAIEGQNRKTFLPFPLKWSYNGDTITIKRSQSMNTLKQDQFKTETCEDCGLCWVNCLCEPAYDSQDI